MNRTKFAVWSLVFAMGLLAASLSWAEEGAQEADKPTANLNVSFFSQYIWRGYELSKDSLVIFPSLTVGYKGFDLNVWVDFDTHYKGTGTHELWETDWVLTYSNSWNILNFTFGWIFYDVDASGQPDPGRGDTPVMTGQDAQELFLTLGADVLLSPTLSVYREIQNGPAWYFKFDLSHSFELQNGWSVDLGAWVSYNDNETADYRSWHDGTVWAALNIPLNEYFTVTPTVNYTFPLSEGADDLLQATSFDGNDSQHVYGGIIIDCSL